MQCRINASLRSEVKQLMIEEKYLLATKLLKRIKVTNSDSFEVRFYINYNLALCYKQLNQHILSYNSCTKAEELFTKEEGMVANILYQNYDYKKLMKLMDELKERFGHGEINCHIG